MPENRELGRHIIAEFLGCSSEVLNDIKALRKELIKAAERAGATIVEEAFHKFEPQGVSGIVIIGESHLSIHTWPEYGYAAVDIFTCGEYADPWKAYEELKSVLKPKYVSVMEVKRGVDIGEWSRQ